VETLLIALFALGGAAVAKYFADQRSSVGVLEADEGSPEERMHRQARGYAIADLVVMAVLADGVVTEDEWARLRRALAEEGTGIDAAEATSRLEARAEALKDRRQLRKAVALAAAPLSSEDREQVLRIVVDFARNGSAAMATSGTGYRVAERTDPATLIQVFAEALDLPPDARARARC